MATSDVDALLEKMKLMKARDEAAWMAHKHLLPATSMLLNGLYTIEGWRLKQTGRDVRGWVNRQVRSTVIESITMDPQVRVWHHVSVARNDRDPTHAELMVVKRLFVGDREAYQVYPPRSRYVNQHPHCLHLWACLTVPEGAVLPDFTEGMGSI